jgi:hypothetical protein
MKSSRKSSAKALTFAESVRLRLDAEARLRAYREAPVEGFPIPEGLIPNQDDLDDLADVDPELFRQRPDPKSASRRGQKIAVEKRREKAKPAEEWFAAAHARNPEFGRSKLAREARKLFRLNRPNPTPEELDLLTPDRAQSFLDRKKSA